jgi:Skp family chaperone for outer membrane proteins
MQKILTTLAITLSLSSINSIEASFLDKKTEDKTATDSAAATQASVGVCDKADVFYKCEAGSKFSKELQERLQKLQAHFVTEENKLRKKSQDPKANQKTLQEKHMQLQKIVMEKKEALNQASATAEQKIGKTMEEIMKEISAEKKLQYILERGAIVYGEGLTDISGDVLTRVNAKMKDVDVSLPNIQVEEENQEKPAAPKKGKK